MIIAPAKVGNEYLIRKISANNHFKAFAPRKMKKQPLDQRLLRSVAHSQLHHYQEGNLAVKNAELSPNILSLPKLPPLQNCCDHINRNIVSIIDFSRNASNFTASRNYNPVKSFSKQFLNKASSSKDKPLCDEIAPRVNQLQDSDDFKNLKIEPIRNNNYLLLPKNNLSALEKIITKELAKDQGSRRKNESVRRPIKKALQFKETKDNPDSRSISASYNKILPRMDASHFDIAGW